MEICRKTHFNFAFRKGLASFLVSLGLLLSVPMALFAQQADRQFVLSGVVYDQAQEPVIGANVLEKGTTNGTITDIDGNFSLSVSPGSVIVISFIGYNSQEIKVDNQKSITVRLQEDYQALDEVLVIGYGTTKRQDFTGSVSSVKLENSPIALSQNLSALDLMP